ncbi:MAG: hypothetical protein N3A65_08775 [candidate division WOR-3 bacterium]|nr:hypothetical protein [candidate division WOR-3 bacterium]
MLSILLIILFNHTGLATRADSLDRVIAEQIKSGSFENALRNAEELLGIYEKMEDTKKYSDCLATIGFIYGRLNNDDKALEFYNQSLKSKYAIMDSAGILKVLFLRGVLYKDLNQYKESAIDFETALNYAEILNQKSLQGSIILVLGKTYYELGETFLNEEKEDSAEYYYLRAIEKAKSVGDTTTLTQAYHSLGANYIYLFHNGSLGRTAYLNALKLYQNYKDRKGEVDVLNDLCKSYFVIPGDSIIAGIKYGVMALSLADSINYLEGYALSSENLGDLHKLIDNFNQSSEYYIRSAETLKKINDHWTLSRIFYKLAQLFFDHLPADTTLRICEIGKISARESKNMDYLKLILGIEYLVHNRRHNFDNAIKIKEELLNLYKSEDNKKEQINTLIDLTNAYFNKNDYEKFKKFLNESEKLAGEANYIEGEIKIMMIKGEYYLNHDNIDSLVVLINKIFPKLLLTNDKELISDVFNWLGMIAFSLGNFNTAMEFLNNGLLVIDRTISEIDSRDRISIIKSRVYIRQNLISLAKDKSTERVLKKDEFFETTTIKNFEEKIELSDLKKGIRMIG